MNIFLCNLVSVWCNYLAVDVQPTDTRCATFCHTHGHAVFIDDASTPNYPLLVRCATLSAALADYVVVDVNFSSARGCAVFTVHCLRQLPSCGYTTSSVAPANYANESVQLRDCACATMTLCVCNSRATCRLRWYFPEEERMMQYSRDKYFP
jgi:hypothetical protein